MRYDSSVYRTFGLITQLGLSMLAPILLCVFLGRYLEDKYQWPVFIPLLLIGILAGCRNSYLLAQGANQSMNNKEQD